MFQLRDLRESKVWQEAYEEGRQEGWKEGYKEAMRELLYQDLVKRLRSTGKSIKEIAELLDVSQLEVRRLSGQSK